MEENKSRKYEVKKPIPRVAAEEQFKLLEDFYDIDMEYLSERPRTLVEKCRLAVIKAITRGILTVEDAGKEVVIRARLRDGRELKFGEPGLHCVNAVQGLDSEEQIHAWLAAAAEAESPEYFKKLSLRGDRPAVEAVATLFLLL